MHKKKTIANLKPYTRNPCKSWNEESIGIPGAQEEPYIPDGPKLFLWERLRLKKG